MTTPSSELLSNIMASGGYARPHHFDVEITPPIGLRLPNRFSQLKRLSLNCTSSVLPGKTIATKEYSPGGTPVRKVPHSFQVTDFPCQFYLSDDLLEKSMFDSWQGMINDDVWQNLAYYDTYVGTVTLKKTSRKIGRGVTGSYSLHEAYPLIVGEPELSYSAQDQIMVLPVTFAYRHWTPSD